LSVDPVYGVLIVPSNVSDSPRQADPSHTTVARPLGPDESGHYEQVASQRYRRMPWVFVWILQT
jgi:hypothetical protein